MVQVLETSGDLNPYSSPGLSADENGELSCDEGEGAD